VVGRKPERVAVGNRLSRAARRRLPVVPATGEGVRGLTHSVPDEAAGVPADQTGWRQPYPQPLPPLNHLIQRG
jgi:hypothetical protein